MNTITNAAVLAGWAMAIATAYAAARKPARRRKRPTNDFPRRRPRSRPLGPRAGGALPSEHEFDSPRTIRTRTRR